jgi:general secretion pathway protein H
MSLFDGLFRSSQRGFTLIELLVVVIIMGFFSSMVFLSVASGIFKSREERFVRDFEYELKRARVSAIGQGRLVRFMIDGSSRKSGILGRNQMEIPESIQVEGKGILEDEEGRYMILFFPDGSASGGEIDLKWEDGRLDRISIGIVWGEVRRESRRS